MNEESFPDYLILGKIVKPRGLKGEIKASFHSYNPEALSHLKEVYLKRDLNWEKLSVIKSIIQNGFWYLTFKEIDSLEKARGLGHAAIAVPSGQWQALPENRYYHFQLRGLKVVDISLKELGTVSQIVNHPACDFLLVEGDQLLTIPLSRSVIQRIDLTSNTLYLNVKWE